MEAERLEKTLRLGMFGQRPEGSVHHEQSNK